MMLGKGEPWGRRGRPVQVVLRLERGVEREHFKETAVDPLAVSFFVLEVVFVHGCREFDCPLLDVALNGILK